MKVPYGPEAVLYDDGTIGRGVATTVVLRGTSTPALIYSDSAGASPLANPTSSDSLGNLFFCADPGEYDLLLGGARIPISLVSDATAGVSYVHTQTISNATWTIIHGLARKPQVSVEIGGAEVIADVTWPDDNTVLVNLDIPRLGKAYLT